MTARRKWSGWVALWALVGCGEAPPAPAEVKTREAPAALASNPSPSPGPATLVKDLHTAARNRRLGDARNTFVHGSHLYFSGALWELEGNRANFSTVLPNMELWRTDGTPEGTELVKDLAPETEEGSNPRAFTVWKDTLYFLASPKDLGGSLWSTDGTPEGTVLRHRFQHPLRFFADNQPFLSTRHGLCMEFWLGAESRSELWCKDDSPLGLVRLAGPWEAAGSGGISQWYAVHEGTAHFRFKDQLWRTDGSPEGTRPVEPAPGLQALAPTSFTPFQGALYFEATASQPGLWKTDFSAPGTALVRPLPDIGCGLGVSNGTLWLPALTSTEGQRTQLWKSDGTAGGTSLVASLSPSAALCPASFQPLDARTTLFLLRPSPYPWTESGALWRTDGTPEGTLRLHTFDQAPVLTTLGGVGYVLAATITSSTSSAPELWRTDGTPEGTQPVKRLRATIPALQSALAFGWPEHRFSLLPGRLLFPVRYAPGAGAFLQLVTSDGTAEGTRPVLDVTGPTNDSQPVLLVSAGARVYFLGRGPQGALFTSDGTAEGTVALRPMHLENTNYEAPEPARRPMLTPLADGRVFFRVEPSGQLPGQVHELWISNGTPAGTVLVKAMFTDALTPVDSTLFFLASGTSLWRSDGTPEGTVEVKGLGANASQLTAVGGTLYFVSGGTALWKSDGTAEGTVEVKPLGASASLLTPVGGTLYFVAGGALWKSDGSPEGTVRLMEASPGVTLSALVAASPGVYFRRDVPASGNTPAQVELWRSEGTPEGTVRVHHAERDLQPLAGMGGALYFQTEDPEEGWELWRVNASGPGRVKDLMARRRTGRIVGKVLAVEEQGKLFFAAVDANGGLEPWVSDGTPGGTGRVQDVAPGATHSAPSGFVRAGERVFFSAYDIPHGRELWSMPVSTRRERLAPEIICPASRTAETASEEGQTVEYPAAFAHSDDPGTPVVTYSKASGSLFPVGGTTVTATATPATATALATEEDAPSASCQFTVTVTRPTPPDDTPPDDTPPDDPPPDNPPSDTPPDNPPADNPPPAEPPAPPPPPPLPTMDTVGGSEPRLGCGVADTGTPWLVLAVGAWLARRRRAR
jgi:ELWxxDGT repeat protein